MTFKNRQHFVKEIFQLLDTYEVKQTKKEAKNLKALLNTCYVLGGKSKASQFYDEMKKAIIKEKEGVING